MHEKQRDIDINNDKNELCCCHNYRNNNAPIADCWNTQVCQLLPAERRSYAGHVGLYSYGNNIVVIMPKTGSTNLLYEICAIDGQECMKKAKSANPHYFMLG